MNLSSTEAKAILDVFRKHCRSSAELEVFLRMEIFRIVLAANPKDIHVGRLMAALGLEVKSRKPRVHVVRLLDGTPQIEIAK